VRAFGSGGSKAIRFQTLGATATITSSASTLVPSASDTVTDFSESFTAEAGTPSFTFAGGSVASRLFASWSLPPLQR
jgi:hypothetical protein